MAAKRKAMTKTLRFEVFKRDGFKCAYCGAHPPDVVLQVDHIQPVADGGNNDLDNLITACQPCNLGKSARSLSAVPKSLADKAAEVAEREEQIRGYHAVMLARRERVEEWLWLVAEELDPGCSSRGYSRRSLSSIELFNERLGVDDVLDAARIASSRFSYGTAKAFRYFCGICWNRIRAQETATEGANA